MALDTSKAFDRVLTFQPTLIKFCLLLWACFHGSGAVTIVFVQLSTIPVDHCRTIIYHACFIFCFIKNRYFSHIKYSLRDKIGTEFSLKLLDCETNNRICFLFFFYLSYLIAGSLSKMSFMDLLVCMCLCDLFCFYFIILM